MHRLFMDHVKALAHAVASAELSSSRVVQDHSKRLGKHQELESRIALLFARYIQRREMSRYSLSPGAKGVLKRTRHCSSRHPCWEQALVESGLLQPLAPVQLRRSRSFIQAPAASTPSASKDQPQCTGIQRPTLHRTSLAMGGTK